MVLSELGLELEFKPLIQRYIKFFNSKKRVTALKAKIGHESEESLILKMASIVLKSNETLEATLLKMFEKGNADLQKFELEKAIFDLAVQKFCLEITSLEDLLYKLFSNYFGYNTYGKSRYKVDAHIFVKTWMEHVKYRDLFKALSQKVAKELGIAAELKKLGIERIRNCEIYQECKQAIISWILAHLAKKEKLNEILELIHSRADHIWFEAFANIYQALRYAALLFKEQSTPSFASFKEAVDRPQAAALCHH